MLSIPRPPPATAEQLKPTPPPPSSAEMTEHTDDQDNKAAANRRRYLMINTPVYRRPVREQQQQDEIFSEFESRVETVVDPARSRISDNREVQLCWLALLRQMKAKHMRTRDLYEKLDTDMSDSIDYSEFRLLVCFMPCIAHAAEAVAVAVTNVEFVMMVLAFDPFKVT